MLLNEVPLLPVSMPRIGLPCEWATWCSFTAISSTSVLHLLDLVLARVYCKDQACTAATVIDLPGLMTARLIPNGRSTQLIGTETYAPDSLHTVWFA